MSLDYHTLPVEKLQHRIDSLMETISFNLQIGKSESVSSARAEIEIIQTELIRRKKEMQNGRITYANH